MNAHGCRDRATRYRSRATVQGHRFCFTKTMATRDLEDFSVPRSRYCEHCLKTLRDAPDLSALKDAVLKMCGPRGPAISHEFIFHSEKRSVSCVLEMKYALPDSEMREFAAYGFANVVCLDFELASAQHHGQREAGRRPDRGGARRTPPAPWPG